MNIINDKTKVVRTIDIFIDYRIFGSDIDVHCFDFTSCFHETSSSLENINSLLIKNHSKQIKIEAYSDLNLAKKDERLMSGVNSTKMTLRSVSSHAESLLYIALKCSNNDGSMKLFLIPIHHIIQMRPIYDNPITAINSTSLELGAMNNQDYNIWKPFQFIHTRLELEWNSFKTSLKN